MRFRKVLTLLVLAMGLGFALPAWAQQKPLTRDQVQGLVRNGLGDESGAKLIEQRGIDFAPPEDFLQSLKAAGWRRASLSASLRIHPIAWHVCDQRTPSRGGPSDRKGKAVGP